MNAPQDEHQHNLFAPRHRPYYIYAPPYSRTSAGIRVLHLLCHALNLLGEEAYITTNATCPSLRTPELTDDIRSRHRNEHLEAVAIYPEVVHGNPLQAKSVVRYVMNHFGLLGGPTGFPPTDFILPYSAQLVPGGSSFPPLFLPTVDDSIFNNDNNPDDNCRSEILIYPGRYSEALLVHPELSINSKVITYDWPASHEELANLMRKGSILYCFTYSAIALEAILCGCPVVLMPSPHNGKFFGDPELAIGGFAFENTSEAIALARETIDLPISAYKKKHKKFWQDLEKFVTATQQLPIEQEPFTKTGEWLTNRTFIATDGQFIDRVLDSCACPLPGFHLFIRLQPGQESLLADTLDDLNQQFHSNWHLDIVSTMPSPDGLEDLPCIDWHTVGILNEVKETIDALAKVRQLEWIIELPAGAKPDPLYLWRLIEQSMTFPEARAFFVDDDCYDNTNQRHSPRFKPGVNPAALQSADLSGPICVRRDTWLASGGASQQNGSPWFSQLLRVVLEAGWEAIKHIPDILISYRDRFPSDTQSCLLAVIENLQANDGKGEIVPVSGQSWSLRHAMETPPAVSVAILSEGNLQLLMRCFDSIIEKTDYPDFEILIVLSTSIQDDPGMTAWLKAIQQNHAPIVRTIIDQTSSNHASRSNLATRTAANELTLLIREETVIIQEKWLEELVRTCLQSGIAAVSPCLIGAGTSQIESAGEVLGLNGIADSPYRGEAKLGDRGYLDCLGTNRDVSALPDACMLIRKTAYLAAGGMDDIDLGDHLANIDLCQKLRKSGQRLVYQPLSTVVYSGAIRLNVANDTERQARFELTRTLATKAFQQRWLPDAASDPFWNPNLSLTKLAPTPETDYLAQWQYLPTPAPHILARPLANGQGVFRITSPLRALRKAGRAAECIWPQQGLREPSSAEILRLAPETMIVQHYLYDSHLAGLHACQALPGRPFIVYSLDDLLTNLDTSNPFSRNIPSDSRVRLKYALERSDRLVTSTEFLADSYRHLISDIRVVPNRLEKELWLPLQSRKRSGKKPRIGWAGGTTHQGDLLLLKEIIEQTRQEADWIFFGMCPADIRPLLAEFHSLVPFSEYPARLAALNLDIAVAPLAQTQFNRGKSNLRLLEYGILGIPVVCTDIEPYQNSPACLVSNTSEAWIEALRARIHDPDGREREGSTLRNWVRQNYMLEDHLDDWLSAHMR